MESDFLSGDGVLAGRGMIASKISAMDGRVSCSTISRVEGSVSSWSGKPSMVSWAVGGFVSPLYCSMSRHRRPSRNVPCGPSMRSWKTPLALCMSCAFADSLVVGSNQRVAIPYFRGPLFALALKMNGFFGHSSLIPQLGTLSGFFPNI